ncbi:MAG: TRAP transporter small permease [Eubacteriales bacterium]|jgi:TRAP-type C4-dicarboxylate transport system permease small subunit|nr:TRAP transporter small permease [Eubacteriales bacterium]MDD4105216.1 TRAP transporter small permease [Eubacteriales bacterium]MDD4710438.1 TRAP transporter small permease [Eubacteriales bacterium]NLO16011.1 TRAP transporter small permease [Clostridiales bacterium]
MAKLADIIRKIDRGMHRILLIIAQLSLIGMVTIVCVTVFYRYVLNSGIIWAEEVPRTLVALFAFIACAMGVRDGFHISLGIIYNRFPEGGKGRMIFNWVTHISTFVFGLILLIYGGNLVTKLAKFTMPATKWPRSVQYISLPIAGFAIMVDSLLHMFRVISPDDLIYSEKEKEYKVLHLHEKKTPSEGSEN